MTDKLFDLIDNAQRICFLVGAGISTNAGIPDFRSPGGLFEKYGREVFHLDTFKKDPVPFCEFYQEFSQIPISPTPTHHFIKKIQDRGKLLRCYTQNIDSLELKAGVDCEKLVQVHGHYRTASCICCGLSMPIENFEMELFQTMPVKCTRCKPTRNAYIKPDIIFYGESLPSSFRKAIKSDFRDGKTILTYNMTSDICDLLIIAGTSLQVAPVNSIPLMTKAPRIFVNREYDSLFTKETDLQINDDCDKVFSQ